MRYVLCLSFLIFFAFLTSVDVGASGENEEVICTEDYEMIFKPSNNMPICVKSSSVENFLDRGYTLPIPTQENLRVGLLFSTTGDYSTYGIEGQLAALKAIDDFNEHLKSIDKEEMSLIPEIVNLSTNPENTLEQVKKLHADGVDVFIGPETSAELAMIKPYVDSEQLLVISTSSTAPSLAVADSIYRLVPDDVHQGKLISTLLEVNDITTVFLLVRDDIWGNGLANAIIESYSGNISQISYDPDDPLYEDKLQELSDLVAAEESIKNIAIGVISFGEISEFLLHGIDYDNLDDVRWFGTDSNANEKKITDNEQIAAFAEKVSFKAIQFASDYDNPIHKEIESKLYLELEYLPSTYAFAAYDAVWLVGLSMLDVESIDSSAIASTIQNTSQFYTGGLGELTFNDAGDLVSDNYDIWFVQEGTWYKDPNNIVESALNNLTEKTDEIVLTDNLEYVEQVIIHEEPAAGKDHTVLVLIVLIIVISTVAVFSVWRLRKLLTQLKNSTHIDKSEPTPEPELTEIKSGIVKLSTKEILQHCIQTHSALVADKSIEFLDSSTKDIEIKSDEKQILEIFSPLIKTANGLVGAYGKIEIGVDDGEKNVTFYVKDNGDGISKEKQDRIFKKDDPNTSSGLMLSQESVKEMGGKIWVESVSYLGTSFYFTIPKLK